MRKFFVGLIVGASLVAIGPLMAAQITGGDGYLNGWRVFKGGITLCNDPFIWPATKEIQCP